MKGADFGVIVTLAAIIGVGALVGAWLPLFR